MPINSLLVRPIYWQKNDLLHRLGATFRRADEHGQKDLFFQLLYRVWFDLFPLDVDGNYADNPDAYEKAMRHEQIWIRHQMWNVQTSQRHCAELRENWWRFWVRDELGGTGMWQDELELAPHQKYQRILENREPHVPLTITEDDVNNLINGFFRGWSEMPV